MKIFILGGEGFVGSAFKRFCRRTKADYTVIEPDNYPEVKGGSCELLINADGNSKKYLAEEKPDEDFRRSVLTVLESIRDFNYSHYVYISSIDVYPDHSHPENSREDIPVDIERQSNYGFHKFLAEQLIKHYAARWLIVRLGGMLGPGLKKNPIFDLLHDQPLRTGEDSRFQYLSTDLVAEITMALVEGDRWGEVFNICGRGMVSLKEVRQWLDKPRRYFQDKVPIETYEINNEKIGRLFDLPESSKVAREFINRFIKGLTR